MADEEKIMVEDEVTNRDALRASVQKKLTKPTIYRSIDIDVRSEEAQKRAQMQAAMDAMQAQAQKNQERSRDDLTRVAQNLAGRITTQEQPKKESGLTGVYKKMMRGLGFKVD